MASINHIQQTVCAAYGVAQDDLVSRRQDRAIVLPRHVAMWLARHATPMSLPEIGRAFGKRDHTTVLHALDNVERWRAGGLDLDGLLRTVREAEM